MGNGTRREVLRSAAALGASAMVAAVTSTARAGQSAGQPVAPASDPYHWTEAEQRDRQLVVAAGLTEEEADCWELVVRAGASFFALAELHPSDRTDIVQAIHVLQTKLMMRPAYRKYRELAKEQRK